MSDPVAVVRVSVLKTGQLQAGPVLSYLLEHPSGKNALYGLGLKSDLAAYPPAVQPAIKEQAAVPPNTDLAWRLEEAERERDTFAAAVLPSTHWTHVGAPMHLLPSCPLLVGAGTLARLPGYPINEGAEVLHLDLPVKARVVKEVTEEDIFGDGSAVVLAAEGNPGALDVRVRTAAGPVLLVGSEGRTAEGQVLSTADAALEARLDADGPWEVALVA
ncbi:hypothetical protein Q8F55_008657 [Vanrija albida]|uniref:Uncharacterized protein n=1 Tax=Vanrija albida TaxID=181172 RepID=A0ABR3PRI2_9TREE